MSEHQETIVLYREFVDGDGLVLENGAVRAYKGGTVVGEAEVAADANLHELMLDYQVPLLLPALAFSHTRPDYFDLVIALSPFSLSDEVTGTVFINGSEEFWVAKRGTHPDFRRTDEVPAGARSWANNADGKGWEFLLPAVWQTHPDPLVHRRLALALEAFLDDAASGRELPIPYRRSFSNIFSAAWPTWRINLPRIISVEARAPSELV